LQRNVLGGRQPTLQVNVDATTMMHAGIGSGYVQQIIATEVNDFLSRVEGALRPP
jgi:ABC-2 type transport system permease protein